jgi:hypothetical protein
MTPVNAKVNRRGITYKDLYYLNPADKQLQREMYDAGTKKKDFEARMDMRDVGTIYYLRDNKLTTAKLNPLINGNAEYSGLTMKQYEDYRRGKKELLAAGRVNNEALSAFNYAMNHAIVESSTKPMLPSAKNMRPAREIEKQAKSKSNRISKRLPTPQLEAPATEDILVAEFIEETTQQPIVEAVPEKKTNPLATYSSWDEALEDW